MNEAEDILAQPFKLRLTTEKHFTRPELLLHPPIPPVLRGRNPRTTLGKEWWDATRKEAFKEGDYHCWACGVHQLDAEYHNYLDGHECYEYDYSEHRAYYIETVGLCYYCHQFIHFNALRYSPKMADEILRHGLDVLSKAGLRWPENQAFWQGRRECTPKFWDRLTAKLAVHGVLPHPPRKEFLADDWKVYIPLEEVNKSWNLRS